MNQETGSLILSLTAGSGSSAEEKNTIFRNALCGDAFPSHVSVVVFESRSKMVKLDKLQLTEHC